MSLRTRSRSIKGAPESPTEGIRVSGSRGHGENDSLIEKPPAAAAPPPAPSRQALSQVFSSTAHLANLLPTGTLLAFQLLTPVFTNNGSCDGATRPMTQLLLLLLAASTFLACLTDSFRSRDGQVYYGLATSRGMWLFDYPAAADPAAIPDLTKYRLRFVDFVHGVLSVLVFGAVALRDKNVVGCFYPQPEQETQEVLSIAPLGIGILCSLLFVAFPTRRHGIGYPVTNAKVQLGRFIARCQKTRVGLLSRRNQGNPEQHGMRGNISIMHIAPGGASIGSIKS